MSEELKLNMPLFNINEEAELENNLKFHLDEFTNEIMKTMSRDKDIVILKKVIEQQQKEINFYKNEELGYIAGYEDGKRHKQTAVMIKKENAQQELFEKEIARLKEIIEKRQKEIEELKEKNKNLIFQLKDEEKELIEVTDKIREKVKQLEKGNRSLMESRKKWKNRYYKEKAKNKEKKIISQAIIRDTFIADYISKDKIRELLKSKDIELTGVISYRELEELLEE